MPKKQTHFPMRKKQQIYNFLRDNNIEYADVLDRFNFTTRQGLYKWLTGKSKASLDARLETFEQMQGEYK